MLLQITKDMSMDLVATILCPSQGTFLYIDRQNLKKCLIGHVLDWFVFGIGIGGISLTYKS